MLFMLPFQANCKTCLNFVHNEAFTNVPVPYLFVNSQNGVFNLTEESTEENNTGTIQKQGTFGSCGS